MSEPTQQPAPDGDAGKPAETAPAKPEAANPDPAPAKPEPAPAGHSFTRVTLTQLTLLVVLGIFAWQWLDAHNQLAQIEQQVARRMSEVEAASKANQILVKQNQELVRQLGGKLGLVESRTAETQNQRTALENLYQQMSSGLDQTALAEVEQMLLIANQQLQLSSNVKAALIALQQAKGRLQGPALAGLRKRISQDIDKLRGLPDADLTPVNRRLEGVIAIVDKMVLAQDARMEPPPKPAAAAPREMTWQRFWSEFWQETRSVVSVQNTGQKELPLLPPSETFFLRENLKLHLLTARLALLTRDEAAFRRDLNTARAWIEKYFDTHTGAGAEALAELKKLAAADIALNLPDLNGSLEAVRNYRAAHDRSAK